MNDVDTSQTGNDDDGKTTTSDNTNPDDNVIIKDAGKTGDGDDDIVLEGDDVDQKKLKKILADRRSAKRKAKELADENEKLKARVEKADKEEKKRLEADMTEKEKAIARAEEAEERAELAEQAAARASRVNKLISAGVDSDYQDIIEAKLATAQALKDDLNVDTWLEEFKDKHPKLFTEESPVSTGAGHQRSSEKSKLDALRLELKEEKDPSRKFWLMRALKKEERKVAQ